ncbi:unnamed protein product [Spirodela intermedia]|uniref:Uncharacterized protein n=1 Tax=Spirodela intermedia TaxID=51605 RepID=A0A7I8KUB3_SPIIN|nr:unnamed protein product [Spirodela intermedia]
MAREGEVIPSSPTISSPSSSDLDTESTGSFFPDRSTTLGTLMGVSLIETPAARPPAVALLSRGGGAERGAGGGAGRQRGRRRTAGRRRWWKLCRGEDMAPTSLADFLQVERRLSGGELAGEQEAHLFYGGGGEAEHEAVGGGPLFDGGRVLPPPPHPHRAETGSLGRLPVLLTGICSGSDG